MTVTRVKESSYRKLYFFLLILAASLQVSGQDCVNCKEVPKLTQFDFDIKVPTPNAADGTENLWPEWKNLFMIASMVGNQLMLANPDCIRITIPPSFDSAGTQEITVGGETFTNLPSNPLISADLSKYGDYLLTGVITANGTECKLHAEIQTSCSRKIVAIADISFSLSSVSGNVSGIAQQLVNQFSPLSQKIRQFELDERTRDKSLSLFQTSSGEPIKITPDKETLKAGESTSFTIELRDCDGKPLAGREIRFAGSNFEGLKVPATIGGTVSPASVTTDANGKARATFTLTGGSHEALIAAYSPGKNVKGCESMFYGDAPINIRYTYSGYIKYSYESSSNCSDDVSSGCLRSTYNGVEKMTITYNSSFYIDPEKSPTPDFFVAEDDESESMVPDKLDGGSYSYRKTDIRKGIIICESVSKGQTTVQKILASQDGELKSSNFGFSVDNNSAHVNINLNFLANTSSKFSQTYLPEQSNNSTEEISWNVSFDSLLGNELTVKKQKIGNKTRYTIEGKRTLNLKCSSNSETIRMVIDEE